MNLYRISQDKNRDYDTFDSAVVAAETEWSAQHIHPSLDYGSGTWCAPEFVKVELVGAAKEGTSAGTVICASFNAG